MALILTGATGAQAIGGQMVLPTFLIIGAHRSGTTALARYLGAHPDVFMAREKEIRFFDRHYEQGTEWYSQRFRAAPAVGEASPGYMYDDQALVRIREDLPGVRLIAQLRNPIDRAYSHYWSRAARGKEQRTFDSAVAAELEGLPDAFPYLGRGRYLEYLLNTQRHFDRRDLLVLLFDDMVRDPRGSFQRACSFLSVDTDARPSILGRQINPYVQFRSLHLRRFNKRLPLVLKSATGRMNVRAGGYPPLPPAIRETLRDYFREDNRVLAEWLGIDLRDWVA